MKLFFAVHKITGKRIGLGFHINESCAKSTLCRTYDNWFEFNIELVHT